MEGKLIKTEHGWYVSYRWESDLRATDGGFIPLDPSDVLSADLNFPDSLNKPVFFDMTEPSKDGVVYAKIHAYIDEDVIEMSESFGVDVKCPPDCPHCAYEHQQLYEEELEKEAAIDFARLAGFRPAGVLVEIMNADGTMARLPDLTKVAAKFKLKLVSIKDLIAYRMQLESQVKEKVAVNMPTAYGDFKMIAYEQQGSGETHLALIKGKWKKNEPVLVRVHSSCVTGDIFGSCRCDCGPQLHRAMQMVEQAGKGVVLYMKQEGRGIGLLNKLKAYELQEKGYDTVEANLKLGFDMDPRDYGTGAQILHQLGISKIKLITNNPKKRVGLMGYGLEIVENIPIEITPNPHNEKYLATKRDKLGHNILKSKKKSSKK